LVDGDDPDGDAPATWYADSDGDGYGDASSTSTACTQPSGYAADDTDCDDGDGAINPAATETCDGVDNDCDGLTDDDDTGVSGTSTWYEDGDGDGYGDPSSTTDACDQPTDHVADDTDCDDADAGAWPGADEYCDGVDNDCDGTTDEDDAVDATTWYMDYDGDGYGGTSVTSDACTAPSGYVADDTDCDDGDADINPGAVEICNGDDDDCDGLVDDDDPAVSDPGTWYADDDGDFYGDATTTTTACDQPGGYVADSSDCDDGDSTVHPGAADTWYDGVDSDCDEWSDYDQDGDGYDSEDHGGEDCDDTDAAINPDATETFYDGVDADCDDLSDYDADLDGHDSDSYGGGDCDDSDAAINPDATETWYDGVDADCDGLSDYDADLDGYESDDHGGDDCDDDDASAHPGATETYYDGVDGDCDGLSDYDADLDGYDSVDHGGMDCDDSDPHRALYCSDGVADWIGLDSMPQALTGMAAVLDQTNQRLLVYGGLGYHELSETLYEYDLGTSSWAALSPSGTSPGPRGAASVIFDEADGYVWLFGGEEYYALSDEVYLLDASSSGSETWSPLTASSSSPDPRLGAATVLDDGGDRMLVIGGQGYHGLLDDLWSLDLTTTSAASWTELSPSGTAPERAFAAAVYDPNYEVVYLLGGETYNALAEDPLCLDLSSTSWSILTTTGDDLPPLAGAAAVWASDFGAVLLHGGATYHQLSSTSYLLQATDACVVEVTALTASGDDPGVTTDSALLWNASEAMGVMLGGESYHRLVDDVTEVVP